MATIANGAETAQAVPMHACHGAAGVTLWGVLSVHAEPILTIVAVLALFVAFAVAGNWLF